MGDSTDDLLRLASQITPLPPPRELDMLLTAGERISMALLAMAIHSLGHDAVSFTGSQAGIITSSEHGRAKIIDVKTARIQEAIDQGKIVIVAGFQGVSTTADVTTLGRGGSDTTAVALAASLGAEVCEIYTDVDGVYSADPRVVPDARQLDYIFYDEMLEMASLGAQVMHSRSIELAKNYGVKIHVRSSFSERKGTDIVKESSDLQQVIVRGAAVKKNLARVELIDAPNRPGIAADIFRRVAEHGIIVDDIIQVIH